MFRILTGVTAVLALASLGYNMGTASAADLGGDCCADLDERVAELEATTARKGNRVVSLTITGEVNRALMIWDDGANSDAYIVTPAIGTSQINFVGQARIQPGLSAGYHMALNLPDSLTSIVSQVDPDGSGPIPGGDEGLGDILEIRLNNLWIESERLGKITIGHGYSFNDAVSVPFQLGNTYNTDGGPYADGFGLTTSTGAPAGFTWGQLIGNGPRRDDYLRYDSPAFGGFGFMAAVGDDDILELGAKYFETLGRVRLHTAIDYYDYDAAPLPAAGFLANFAELKGIVSMKDLPTGLFLTVWAAQRDYERTFSGETLEDTGHSIQAFLGVEQNYTGYGNTTIYGGYGRFNDMASTGLSAVPLGLAVGGSSAGDFVASSEIDRLTFGIVQTFDAAALDVYLIAEHFSADVTVGDIGSTVTEKADLEDFSTVLIGSRIKF